MINQFHCSRPNFTQTVHATGSMFLTSFKCCCWCLQMYKQVLAYALINTQSYTHTRICPSGDLPLTQLATVIVVFKSYA